MRGEYINGDCMEYLKDYADNHFDLAIVDPPYGIGRHKACGQRNNGFQEFIKHKKNWDNERPTDGYFKELKRVCKNLILWGANYFIEYIEEGYTWLVWDKVQPEGVSFAMHELAVYSNKSQPKIYKQSIASNSNRATNRFDAKKYERIHPTQKPIALYKWLLKNYAKESDLILDTHVGSASSLIACEDMGFDYVGFELDKDYYRDSMKRLKNHISQLKMF